MKAQPKEEPDNAEAHHEPRPIKGTLTSQDTPPESVDDSHHGVHTVKQAPFFRNDLSAETHRGDVKSELHQKRNDVPKIPVFYIEGGNPKAGAHAGQQGEYHKWGEQQNIPAGRESVIDHHNQQDDKADQEIYKCGNDRRSRDDQSRKIDLSNEVCATN